MARSADASAAAATTHPPQPLEHQAPYAWAALALRSWQLGNAMRKVYYSGTHMPVDGWFQPCRCVLCERASEACAAQRDAALVNLSQSRKRRAVIKRAPATQQMPLVDDL